MAQSCSATLEALALAQNALYKFKELEALPEPSTQGAFFKAESKPEPVDDGYHDERALALE